ncbi:MAG TPA: hypothetical protein VLC92_21515 [Rhodocyclaceae bacterium]|nr:hypothetical protein [Rhodocyclaceae bacterium]
MNAPVQLSGSIQTRINVIATEVKTFPAKENRPAGQYQILKCILHGFKDGAPTIDVGTMRVFGELAKEPVKSGDYFAEFDVGVGYRGDEKGEIVARLVGLKPAQPQDSKAGMQSPVAKVTA